MVSVLITEGRWNDYVQLLQFAILKNQILRTKINSFLLADRVCWSLSSSGIFSTNSAYKALHTPGPRVPWHRLVWSKLVMPRHAFTCWQLFAGNLPTQDRLIRRKVLLHSQCCLCDQSCENSKHLFFDCSYSQVVWNGVKALIGLNTDTRSVNWEWRSILRHCKSKNCLSEVYAAYVCAAVRSIWSERNNRVFNNTRQTATVTRD
ncbi:Zf-rvt domain-containing protein, partial [Thalictrum thalictroides]